MPGGVGLRLLSKLEPRFFCFGLASTDDRPLGKSRRALLVLTTYGENRGRLVWDDPSQVPGEAPLFAKLVKGGGWGPAEIARPAARGALGGLWHWRLRDFAGRCFAAGRGSMLELPAGAPPFIAELWR
jgi:hypothetical protein